MKATQFKLTVLKPDGWVSPPKAALGSQWQYRDGLRKMLFYGDNGFTEMFNSEKPMLNTIAQAEALGLSTIVRRYALVEVFQDDLTGDHVQDEDPWLDAVRLYGDNWWGENGNQV